MTRFPSFCVLLLPKPQEPRWVLKGERDRSCLLKESGSSIAAARSHGLVLPVKHGKTSSDRAEQPKVARPPNNRPVQLLCASWHRPHSLSAACSTLGVSLPRVELGFVALAALDAALQGHFSNCRVVAKRPGDQR